MLTKATYCWRVCSNCAGCLSRRAFSVKALRCYSAASSSNSSSDGPSQPSESDGFKKGKMKESDSKSKRKGPSVVDVVGEKLLDAVNDVAADLHKGDAELKKRTKNDLIAKLTEHEKETFNAASVSQTTEMLSDTSVVDLLADVSANKPKIASRAAEIRHARRGLVLLRREIFYQAKQSGYSADEARAIAERAVEIAEARAVARSKQEASERIEKRDKEAAEATQRSENEQKLYDYAFRMAEKMLHPVTSAAASGRPERVVISPDPDVKHLFSYDGPDLEVIDKNVLSSLKERNLGFWSDLDANAARVWNQSFGPKNGFEEMIELTKKGKMWPYPINNEYMLGEEENVGFHEHIFLDRELKQYKLPKTGPVAHFMELVCVGLSKNSYMTVQKKREHLKWFANYFNEKKVKEVNRLHKQEQDALAEA